MNNDDEEEIFADVTSYLGATDKGLYFLPPLNAMSDTDSFLYGVFLRAQYDEDFVLDLISYSAGPTEEDSVN